MSDRKNEIDEFGIFIIGMSAIIALTGIGLLIAVTCFSWIPKPYNGPPPVGYCTFDGKHLSCDRYLGVRGHNKVHRDFTVIEDTQK